MVIVSSAKSLPKSTKKKSLAAVQRPAPKHGVEKSKGKGSKESSASKNVTATTKFAGPPPPRPISAVATPNLVGGGRGKVKTTRNNTLPLPSPKSGLLSNGPRIHAQRKFAQGASTIIGAGTGLSSVHAGYKSPAATPTKEGKLAKKRVLTPISPPLKRPKTEDFLTFLCFRGTPSLPPELAYFDFAQTPQTSEETVQTKKAKESVSVSTGAGSTSTDNSQNAVPISTATLAMTNGCPPRKDAAGNAINKSSAISTGKLNGKSSQKTVTSLKKASLGGVGKKQSSGVSSSTQNEKTPDKVPISGANKSENGASATKKSGQPSSSKVMKKVIPPILSPQEGTSQISPSTSRINEQDAKFAMTALKLKYQEQRLASARPAKSLITMLTKKVKERSMVLTRSRAKTAVGPLKTSPLQRKRKPIVARPVAPPTPRNAPSPDIILGVATSPVKPVDSRQSSSSESESSSTESEKSSPESSSSSSSESEDEPEPTTRSLRSGKELVSKSKRDHGSKSSSSTSKKSSLPTRRVGTRASHRHTKSPLRELPMWNVNVKKKKILAKYKKNSAKTLANRKNNRVLLSKPGHVTRSSLRKASGFSKGRPSRKTKETAAIYLGLLNKDFSDDESIEESDDEDRASSVGDSSASETKFLEKQYKSSLKRGEESSSSRKKSESRSSSVTGSRSKKNSEVKSKSQGKDKNGKSSNKGKKDNKPLPRVLRSQSTGSVDSSASAAERRRMLLMTCGKNTAGAARKSAKVVSRGRRSRNFSSSEEDEEEKSSESSENEEENGTQSENGSDEESEDEVEEKVPLTKRETTSPTSIASSRRGRAKVKRVAELINESKGRSSPSSRGSSTSRSAGRRSRSASEDAKSLASEVDTKEPDEDDEDEEEEEAEEPDEDEIEEEMELENEGDEIEESEEVVEKGVVVEEIDDEDVIPSPVASVEENEEKEDEEIPDDDVIPSPAPSVVQSNTTSPTTSSVEEVEDVEESEEGDEEDEETVEPPQMVDMCTQVDMDFEEEQEKEEKRLLEEQARLKEEARKKEEEVVRRQQEEKRREEELRKESDRRKELDEIRRLEDESRRQEEERKRLDEKRRLDEEKRRLDDEKRKRDEERRRKEEERRRRHERKRQEEEDKRKAEKKAREQQAKEASSARTSGVQLPLSEQQQAELQAAQDEDDEIQEIGQVINNPAAINTHRRRCTPSPPMVPEPPRIPRPPPQHEQIPISMSIPLPPLASRTSSFTYTSHHINLGASSVPFVPSYSRPSDFFPPPPIHFGNTHLVNSVHLVGSTATAHAGVDFANDLASPLSTLSIPVSVPTLPSFPNPLLPPAPPMCLGPGGATMTATSLQTHIRTVATNLDIPLVRPVVGAADALSFSHLGLTSQSQLGPLLGTPPTASLLSRPLGAWTQPGVAGAAAAAAAAAEARNHYSAFRLPNLQPPPPHSSGVAIGVKDIFRPHISSANSLPVSILHPRTLPHHQPSQPLLARPPLHQPHLSSSRDLHHTSSSSFVPSYNPESIIRNLPNVSIVPKFDRSSVKTQLPSQQPTASSSTSTSSSSKPKGSEEPKKPGKKKGKPVTLPTPSSPLTVRKDSNPATYVGTSSKLKKKSDVSSIAKEKTSTATSPPKKNGETSSSSSSHSHLQEKFDKLLTVKQEVPDPTETPSRPSSCSSSSQKQKGSNSSSGSPGPALIRLDQIKQEVVNCSASRKSSSPSAVQHRKTPDRPISSSSAQAIDDTRKSASKKSATQNQKIPEAPTYHPTEQEFEDPLKFFEKIQPEAEKYGMARIVPPRSFRPDCNVNDDMRFTAYNHYIHKMYNRWGPTVQETEAIKEHLKRSDVDLSTVPIIGGIEIDFSTLYQAVQDLGGLKEVMEREKWAEVADRMHIPKGTHDRASKLDSVYVKYILPYDLLSTEERSNLKKSVDEKWERRQQKLRERTDESSEDETSDEDSMDELDDCVIKGKGTPLSAYYRVARNTVGMIFPNGKEPSIQDMEDEYWKIVREGKKHLCVYSGSIDCAGVGWGFPAPKPSSKHPWNLKVLANNAGSVLRSMGPVMGATVPTLHVSMLFTSYCWYRDPHGLPWVEYLHSGASKIWYSVAANHEQVLRKALMKLMPLQVKNKKLWLPSDSAMVPPELLVENDVPLVRAVQNPGEFLVVFPKSYTSAICAGYLVSESVCFAPPIWLKTCMDLFKDIRDSKEPPVFPIEKLLLSIIRDNRVPTSVIKMAAPLAEKVILEELALRKKIISLGVSQGGKPNKNGSGKGAPKKKKSITEEEVEQCYFCNYILHMSLVRNDRTDFVTCLPHAIQHLSRHKAQIKKCSIMCEETQEELESLLQTAKRRANS